MPKRPKYNPIYTKPLEGQGKPWNATSASAVLTPSAESSWQPKVESFYFKHSIQFKAEKLCHNLRFFFPYFISKIHCNLPSGSKLPPAKDFQCNHNCCNKQNFIHIDRGDAREPRSYTHHKRKTYSDTRAGRWGWGSGTQRCRV